MMRIHHSLKSLKQAPVFMIAVIFSLVLGTASVGTMFAIVHGVLLAPLQYGEPDRLVSVSLENAEQNRIPQPPALYFTYQRFAQQLAEVGIYRTGASNVWSEGDAAESVVATWVSASIMPLLRVKPMLGRAFSADEEIRGGPDAVILSESEWRTRFNADADVIGKTLLVNSVRRQIIGVMPEQFSFPNAATRVWLPAKHTDSTAVGDFSYAAVARLAPGASAESAGRELAALLPRMAESFPLLDSGGSTAIWLDELKPTPVVTPLLAEVTGNIAHTLWMLAAAAALVLLVAWANVVNLMLIRSEGRQLELAIRLALGASWLRNAGHFLSESLILGVIAGAISLLATLASVHAVVAFGPTDIPRLTELSVGLTSACFVVLVTAAGVILCALVPAMRVRSASLLSDLHDGARGHSSGTARQRLRASITVLQIALALVVALGSALLLRTAYHLSQVQPGFDASQVTTLTTQLPFARYDEMDGIAFYARLTERVGMLPSVRAVGMAKKVPLRGPEMLGRLFESSNGQTSSGRSTPAIRMNVVDAGYFAVMRIPLLAGRSFFGSGQEQGDNVIINQRAAASLFGDASGKMAIGQKIALSATGPMQTVIGVVGDVRDLDLPTPPSAMVYKPSIGPGAPRSMTLVVRSNEPSNAIVPAIRQIVRELDPTVPIFDVETMSEVVRDSTARLTLVLTLMSAAAAITLVLGMIGLYGVIAYMVALRTREFGVRIALGAEPRRIARWVALRGLGLSAGGVAIGLILYAFAVPFLRTFLYGVAPTDMGMLFGMTLLLMGTASLATWLPARRAARINPTKALSNT